MTDQLQLRGTIYIDQKIVKELALIGHSASVLAYRMADEVKMIEDNPSQLLNRAIIYVSCTVT